MGMFKDRKLGVASEGSRYDLPLDKKESLDFLTLLVGLMTFLAMMSLAASLVLSGVAKRWSSGLENRLTIEIPAESEGELRSEEEMKAIQDKVEALLKSDSNALSFDPLEKEDIKALLEPWLGKDKLVETMPLPGLISVHLRSSEPPAIEKLAGSIKQISGDINLDTHESWLRDFMRLTDALRMATVAFALLTGIATVAAVAGAARSRMAIHARDVELLHLMGASDEYITRQFQRHALLLSIKGAAIGAAAAFLTLGAIRAFSKGTEASLLPDISLGPIHFIGLLVTPLAACAIASLTARLTVLRALARMP